ITTYDTSPAQYIDFANKFGDSATSLITSAGWARDGRDSFLYPTSGVYQRVGVEVAVPPLDLRYVKASYQYQKWFSLGGGHAIMLNSDAGYAVGYGGGKGLPFYKNFYAGGIGSVRGYEQSSLGPQVISTTDGSKQSLGGNRRLIGNAEYYFPMPGQGKERSMRLSLFFDAGNVWGADEQVKMSDLRYSAGVAFSWSSPVGPLKFSIGQALHKQEGDRTQKFQFQLGTVF
ncbi:MAG: BamA/TamA family outer membrane protein, partial [Zoogloea sp.]|nr:BamA/TamA family outer membrane protein [Zoogloea sp.]